GVGRGKADVTGRQGSAALLAELVGRWIERGAGRARQLEPRSTVTTELGAVRVLVTAPGALHSWYSPPVWVNGRVEPRIGLWSYAGQALREVACRDTRC